MFKKILIGLAVLGGFVSLYFAYIGLRNNYNRKRLSDSEVDETTGFVPGVGVSSYDDVA